MTLLDLCEPLFVFACQVNLFGRSRGEKDISFQASRLFTDLQRVLREMTLQAYSNRALTDQFQLVKPALIYYVDWIGRRALHEKWKSVGTVKGDLGDNEFFHLLDKTLTESSDPVKEKADAAKDRLLVFYTCLGLGFVGSHGNDSEFLAEKIRLVTEAIQTIVFSVDPKAKLCPGANKADSRNLPSHVGTRLAGMAILLAALILIVFVANVAIYVDRTKELSGIIKGVLSRQHHVEAVPAGT